LEPSDGLVLAAVAQVPAGRFSAGAAFRLGSLAGVVAGVVAGIGAAADRPVSGGGCFAFALATAGVASAFADDGVLATEAALVSGWPHGLAVATAAFSVAAVAAGACRVEALAVGACGSRGAAATSGRVRVAVARALAGGFARADAVVVSCCKLLVTNPSSTNSSRIVRMRRAHSLMPPSGARNPTWRGAC
jgi:hypothetical protein